MGMPNVAIGEYSDFYIYHLVVYISYVWLISLFYVGNALGIKAPGCIDGEVYTQAEEERSVLARDSTGF